MAEGGIQTFTYQAVSLANERTSGTMEADGADAVARALHAEGWVPSSIEEVRDRSLNIDLGGLLERRKLRMKLPVLADFCRQLHQLLVAGVSLPQALRSLASGMSDEHRAIVDDLTDRTVRGEPFSDALQAHPHTFDDVFVAHANAGEASGSLPDAIGQYASLLERRAKLNNKIKSVAMYPVLVGGVVFIMLIGIMVFLVPQFTGMYESLDADLPAPTAALVTVSDNFGYVALGLFAAAIAAHAALKRYRQNIENRAKVDTVKFKLPLFGKLMALLSLYRWIATLASMLDAGLPMHRSLDLAVGASASAKYELVNRELRETVQAGRSLATELAEYEEVFPNNVRQMVRTGEQTGDIASLLRRSADAIDDDINRIVSTLSSKLEVLMLVVLGTVVGGVVVVLYLPIIHLSSTMLESM